MDNEIPIGLIYGTTTPYSIQAIKIKDAPSILTGEFVKLNLSVFKSKEGKDRLEVLGRIVEIKTKNRLLETEYTVPQLRLDDLKSSISSKNIEYTQKIAEMVTFKIQIIGYK